MNDTITKQKKKEVTGKVKQPRALCPNFAADKADTLVPIPVLAASPASSDFRFDFDSMAVGFRDAAGDAAVPRVSVPALGKDGRVSLQGCVLGRTNGSPSYISRDDKVAHALRLLAHGDVSQHFVEELYLVAPRLVLYDSSILP